MIIIKDVILDKIGTALSLSPYKPVVKDNILYISDRINGYVTICDISDINSPKLLFREYFAGYPDIPCPVQDGVIVPLGHQGIAKINF